MSFQKIMVWTFFSLSLWHYHILLMLCYKDLKVLIRHLGISTHPKLSVVCAETWNELVLTFPKSLSLLCDNSRILYIGYCAQPFWVSFMQEELHITLVLWWGEKKSNQWKPCVPSLKFRSVSKVRKVSAVSEFWNGTFKEEKTSPFVNKTASCLSGPFM